MEKISLICQKKVVLVMVVMILFMPYVTFASTSNPVPTKVQTTQKYNRYVTVTKNNYPTLQKVGGKQLLSNSKVYQKTFYTKQRLTDNKKQSYVSLYDPKGKFYGVINQQAVKVAKGPEGIYFNESIVVSITSKGYDLFSNFKWNVKQKNNKVLNKTFIAKGRYQHANGSRYYSLYDNKNKWIGYINGRGVKKFSPPKQVASPSNLVMTDGMQTVTGTNSPTMNKTLREAELLYLKKLALLRKTVRVKAAPANLTLNKAAAIRSQDLMKLFDHQRPNGQSWDTVIDKKFANDYYGFGENILIATESRDRSAEYLANRFYNIWRNSPSHYKNMIYADYAVTGVSFAVKVNSSGYEFYATTIFGAK